MHAYSYFECTGGSPTFILLYDVGGMIQGCSLWSLADSKVWKEKNSIAKITRVNSIYLLKLNSLPSSAIYSQPGHANFSGEGVDAGATLDHGMDDNSVIEANLNTRGLHEAGQAAISIRSKG